MRSPSWLAAVALFGSLLLPGCPALVSDEYSSEPPEGEGGASGDAGAPGGAGAPDPGPPRCDDGARNGSETDTDCGGSCERNCAPGQACKNGNDCDSYDCDKGVCQPSRCDNGQKDIIEADVDCGIACPTKCAKDKKCGLGGDCASGKCDKGRCR